MFQRRWGLLPGEKYSLGRLEGDITLPSDNSISKSHATITVSSSNPGHRPGLVLEDVGSRFGTFVNEEIISESQRLATSKKDSVSRALKKPHIMKENDRVRLGVAYTIFTLKWINIEVTSSMLKSKDSLNAWLKVMGQECEVKTNMSLRTSHLVMTNISLSLKVVNCLARAIPIVTPEFFRDLGQCLTTHQTLPHEDDYLPSVSARDAESQLRDPNISFSRNHLRSKLFDGKMFLFMDKAQHDTNTAPCKLAGGDTKVLMEDDNIEEEISQPNKIVISPSTKSMPLSTQLWNQVKFHLESRGLLASSQTDIYLAIVHCSTQTYCNPLRDKTKLLGEDKSSVSSSSGVKTQKSMFVPDTCSTVDSIQPINSRVHVSETLSTRSSAVNNETQTMFTAPAVPVVGDTEKMTADPDKTLKRPRITDSGDEEETPAKKVLNTRDSTTAQAKTTEEGSREGLESHEKENKSTNIISSTNNVDDDQDDEDDNDDIFGFGSLKNKRKRKEQPSANVVETNEAKKTRLQVDDEDDIFGFGSILSESKSKVSQVTPVPVTQQVSPEIKTDVIKEEVDKVIDDNKNFSKDIISTTCLTLNSNGFIGKSDITRVKVESVSAEDNDPDVSSLSSTVAQITITSLIRPRERSSPKKEFVHAGKTVPNFKNFKKLKNVVASKDAVKTVQYVPKAASNTGMDKWLEESKSSKDTEEEEEEDEEVNQEIGDFWNFGAITSKNTKKRK